MMQGMDARGEVVKPHLGTDAGALIVAMAKEEGHNPNKEAVPLEADTTLTGNGLMWKRWECTLTALQSSTSVTIQIGNEKRSHC